LTNQLGGKPVVSFDYTDDYLGFVNGSDFKFADGQNYTVIVLQKTYPAALTYYGHIIGNYLACPDTNTCRMGFELGTNITTGEVFYSSTSTYGFGNLGTGNVSNSWHWLVQKRVGNTVYGYKDGVQEVSFAGGGSYINTGNEVTIAFTPNLALKWTGEIAEIMIYNRDLSNTEMTDLATYFHNKWGI
jgi:hypothetical protein